MVQTYKFKGEGIINCDIRGKANFKKFKTNFIYNYNLCFTRNLALPIQKYLI